MRISTSRIKILTIFAVGCFLLLPGLAAADRSVEFDPVVFGPGTSTQILTLGAQTMAMATNDSMNGTLKRLDIAVQNGTQRGKDKVSSAVINVNGQDIFTQKNFNQNVAPSSLKTSIDVNDPDMQQVVLSVRVNGRKDARLAVTVTAVYEEQEAPILWCLFSSDGMPMGLVQSGMVPPPPMLGGEWRQCP